jgi:hypothetical protein
VGDCLEGFVVSMNNIAVKDEQKLVYNREVFILKSLAGG